MTIKNKKNKKPIKSKNSIKKYKDKIKNLEDKLFEVNEKSLRLLAEFENFKNRSQSEKIELRKYEGINTFKSMLPILDDFERTLKLPALKKNKSLDKGLNMIAGKIKSIFNDIGITSYNSLNEEFNIELHEALMTKESKKKNNMVIEEFEKGYKYHDKVLRHAKVVVSK